MFQAGDGPEVELRRTIAATSAELAAANEGLRMAARQLGAADKGLRRADWKLAAIHGSRW